ncbi:hypothetical protein [Paraburkholderia diazotrophica]|uniref:hypothetical protein n=1 Tax=Paraburkholderia diazotrophica TaxID=667676 RepID=UPI003180A448
MRTDRPQTTRAAQPDIIARARDTVVERSSLDVADIAPTAQLQKYFLIFSDFLRIFWPSNSLFAPEEWSGPIYSSNRPVA